VEDRVLVIVLLRRSRVSFHEIAVAGSWWEAGCDSCSRNNISVGLWMTSVSHSSANDGKCCDERTKVTALQLRWCLVRELGSGGMGFNLYWSPLAPTYSNTAGR
jgi:hypothetical protein